jgi:hypothetical protein
MIGSGVPNWNFVGLDWISVEEADNAITAGTLS